MKEIFVQKMKDDEETRAAMTDVLVDAFRDEFKFFTRIPEKIASAYGHIFVPGRFFTASIDGKIIGMLGVSDNTGRACLFNRKIVAGELGPFRARLAALDMEKELNFPLPIPSGTGFIEYVAVLKEARGLGAATALLSYILKELTFEKYMLEVFKTNEKAISLYKKSGFVISNEKPALPWKAQHKLVMRLDK